MQDVWKEEQQESRKSREERRCIYASSSPPPPPPALSFFFSPSIRCYFASAGSFFPPHSPLYCCFDALVCSVYCIHRSVLLMYSSQLPFIIIKDAEWMMGIIKTLTLGYNCTAACFPPHSLPLCLFFFCSRDNDSNVH